ncbi:unnamed protein product, partial [Ixodes hexagonus]
PVLCRDHVVKWDMDIRSEMNQSRRASFILAKDSLFLRRRARTSASTDSSSRGLLSSAKEQNVPVFVYFFSVAFLKRKRVNSELSIVRVCL